MTKLEILRAKIPKLTALLTKSAVKVTQRGAQAYVKYNSAGIPTLVNIPFIPDNATPEFISAIEGFLDHEVGHVLYSDGQVAVEAQTMGQLVSGMHNIIEDTFIERRMTGTFPGSLRNIAIMHNLWIRDYVNAHFVNNPDDPLNLIVPMVRAWSGQQAFIDYMADKQHLPNVVALEALLGKYCRENIPKIMSSREALDVTIVIAKMLEDARKQAEEPKEEQKKEQKKQNKPEQKTGGEGDTPEEEGEKGPSTDPDAEPGDEDEGESQPGEKGDSETQQGEESDVGEPGEQDTGDGGEPQDSNKSAEPGEPEAGESSQSEPEPTEGETPEGESKQEDEPEEKSGPESSSTQKDKSPPPPKEQRKKPKGDAQETEGDEAKQPEQPQEQGEPEQPQPDNGQGKGESEGSELEQAPEGELPEPAEGAGGSDTGSEGEPDDEEGEFEGELESSDSDEVEGNSASENGEGSETEGSEEVEGIESGGEGNVPDALPDEPLTTDEIVDYDKPRNLESNAIPFTFDPSKVKDSMRDFDTSMSELITREAIPIFDDAEYKIFSRDWDEIIPFDIEAHGQTHKSASIELMQETVDKMVGNVRNKLERAVMAQNRVHQTTGHRSGRIDGGTLTRLVRFNDDRVFKRKHETKAKNTALTLLIDCSGSMSLHNKIGVAAYAAYGMAMALERIGVKYEILGFTTGDKRSNEFYHESVNSGVEWSRYDSIYMPIFKSFEEKLTPQVKKNLASLKDAEWLRNNIDGESVEYAALRLLPRQEERKILMVLSDGNPVSTGNKAGMRAHLKRTVQNLTKRGVEVLGVGIMDDAVKAYYPKHVVIKSIKDLPTTVISEVQKLLLS
ncbi:hypothetical protein [Methylobacillus sp.]|uniref:cobaltochelatase CobT-related protein n=1 Tax=Methylobacillus sp. TaxID=56818 RepID=UPI0012C3018C|nr:hypothetical protein [Methylobacillus sp.]MPS48468.1 hypothetical protein [Methylobacillus sp.]